MRGIWGLDLSRSHSRFPSQPLRRSLFRHIWLPPAARGRRHYSAVGTIAQSVTGHPGDTPRRGKDEARTPLRLVLDAGARLDRLEAPRRGIHHDLPCVRRHPQGVDAPGPPREAGLVARTSARRPGWGKKWSAAPSGAAYTAEHVFGLRCKLRAYPQPLLEGSLEVVGGLR